MHRGALEQRVRRELQTRRGEFRYVHCVESLNLPWCRDVSRTGSHVSDLRAFFFVHDLVEIQVDDAARTGLIVRVPDGDGESSTLGSEREHLRFGEREAER